MKEEIEKRVYYEFKVKDYTTILVGQMTDDGNKYFVQRGDGTKYEYWADQLEWSKPITTTPKLYNKEGIELRKPEAYNLFLSYNKGVLRENHPDVYEQCQEYQQAQPAEVIMKELREEVDFWKDNHFDKKIRDLKQEVERLESRIRGELGACSVKMDDGWRSPTDEEMSKIIDGYKKTPTVHEQLNAKEERVKQLEEGIDYINEHYSPHVTGLELKCELLLSKDTKPD